MVLFAGQKSRQRSTVGVGTCRLVSFFLRFCKLASRLTMSFHTQCMIVFDQSLECGDYGFRLKENMDEGGGSKRGKLRRDSCSSFVFTQGNSVRYSSPSRQIIPLAGICLRDTLRADNVNHKGSDFRS